jgi:pimeloyl-ACP methyl ester carboxylesterase
MTQLWGEWSDSDLTGHDDRVDLVVLRLLGARGRAELSTQDPANRLSGIRSITWTMNPPGFGGSKGNVTIGDYLRHALDAYDSLSTRFPTSRLWVYGKSIGATAAIFLAAHRPLADLIVKNVIDVPSVTRRRLARCVPQTIANLVSASIPTELHPTRWSCECRCPALFVISTADKLAPPDSQEAVRERYGGSATSLVVHGGHDEKTLASEDEFRYRAAIAALWKRTN